MQDIETLIAEHDHMAVLCDRLVAMVEQDLDLGAILAVRARLSVTLEDHLDREDSSSTNA